jgi:hypothetical protein
MPRPRGGKRQGTPGAGYSNRTDLTSNYDMGKNTAATGGEAPSRPRPMVAGPLPDEIPNLDTPTARPQEPITAGLPIGAGAGPTRDNRAAETANLKKYLPMIEPYIARPDTPDSVRYLFRYIRGS